MDYVNIICIVLLIGCIIFTIIHNKKIDKDNQIQLYLYKKELEKQINEEANKKLQEIHSNCEKKFEQKYNDFYEERVQSLHKVLENARTSGLENIQNELDEWAKSAQEAATFNFKEKTLDLDKAIGKLETEKIQLENEVNEFRRKREAINEEIMRQRAIEADKDHYRIQLKEMEKEDISFLISLLDRFHNKETISKLIWTEYLQKPFKAMTNRVLGARDPKNVIYMITNLNTQEVYIGKTKAEVSKRWTEHIKSSLGIGTISHSNLHSALWNQWDNFVFDILEEVPETDNLGEREKYYINFYQSDVYGYNIKSGG